MKVLVQVLDDLIEVSVGTGRNKISWLCNSAVHRCDRNSGFNSGMWTWVEDETGAKINHDAAIAEKIRDGGKVVLKFDPVKEEEAKAGKNTAPGKSAAAPGKAGAAKKK